MTLDAGIRKYKEAATFIVAASDSLHKERADYVCSGTNDDVTIQAAIDALPSGGGDISLLDGLYKLTATINVNKNNVLLEGMGLSTILKVADSTSIIAIIVSESGCHIKSLKIDGNKANNSEVDPETQQGIKFTSNADRCILENCMIENVVYWGVYVHGCENTIIKSNIIRNNGHNNIIMGGSGAKYNLIIDNHCIAGSDGIDIYQGANRNIIKGNICKDNSQTGITIHATSVGMNTIANNLCIANQYGIWLNDEAVENSITGNILRENTNHGLFIRNSSRNTIVGNSIIDNGGDGIALVLSLTEHNLVTSNFIKGNTGSGVSGYLSTNNVVINNFVYDDAFAADISDTTIMYRRNTDLFMDVLAASNVHIHAAQAGNSASQDVAATTQPDVPRNTKLTTTNNGQVLEGCLCDDGGTVTDETADINNVAANDVPLLPAVPEENDAIYFGNYDKFDKLTIDIGTQGVKAPGDWSIAWEYWDGDSWEALADVVDGTAEFTAAAGNHDVTFTVPTDWAEKEINITAGGSITAYWIRARVNAATTNPIGAQPLADQGWIGIYGTVTVTGVDAKGNSTTDTLLITRTNAGGTVALDVAFATVTKYNIPAGVSAANTVACGIGIKLGLSNIIYETSDVYKIKKNAADEDVAAAQVNTTYDTYDMSVIGLAATNDFTIWFKSNLNIIS